MKCIQCDSTDIVQNVRAVDRGKNSHKHNLVVETQRYPTAWVFKGAIEAPLRAAVCGSCGFVMFYANPHDVQQLKNGNPPLD